MHDSIIFKMKHRGQKIKVRLMSEEETIKDNCLHTLVDCFVHDDKSIEKIKNNFFKQNEESIIESLKRKSWLPTEASGEKVNQHKCRFYLEVLSPFYLNKDPK